MFRHTLQRIANLVPSQCVVCHAWPSRRLCSACVARFAQPVPRCETCALPVLAGMRQCGRCITNRPPMDRALSAVAYQYPWSTLIQQLKFHDDTAWTHAMAALMRSTPWVEPALEAADALIPMPLFPSRLRERGFNQADLLARALEPRKVRRDVLLRIRDTGAQHALPRNERLRNVQGAFALEPAQYAFVAGKRLVLVDDVMTTGASLHAAASALRAAGALHITALVFARTE